MEQNDVNFWERLKKDIKFAEYSEISRFIGLSLIQRNQVMNHVTLCLKTYKFACTRNYGMS